jgi:hypothetical protein
MGHVVGHSCGTKLCYTPGAEDDLKMSVITDEVEIDMEFLTQLEWFIDEL